MKETVRLWSGFIQLMTEFRVGSY